MILKSCGSLRAMQSNIYTLHVLSTQCSYVLRMDLGG